MKKCLKYDLLETFRDISKDKNEIPKSSSIYYVFKELFLIIW